MRRHSSDRGFTILEILVSMSLFTLIGFGVVSLLSTGVDMYVFGNRAAQQEDRVELSLPLLGEDLRMLVVPSQRDRIPHDPKNPDPQKEPLPLPPDNRLVSGYHLFKVRNRENPIPVRYLAFVREIGKGDLDVYASRAGTNPKADAYIDGKNDEEEFNADPPRHLPTEGMMEVLWILVPDVERRGVSTLCRAYRSPIGGKDSLLLPENHNTLEKVMDVIQPQKILPDVLHFDLLFWTQYTTTWKWTSGEPRITVRPRSEVELKSRRFCGPSRTWDSTRGRMPKGPGISQFALSRGKSSENFSADDIWPRMIRVEFSLLEEETFISGGISSNALTLEVESTRFAMGRGALENQYFKIDDEFVEISHRDGAQYNVFRLIDRGGLGSAEVSHGEDAKVYFGRLIDFVVEVPSFRDDNN